MSSIIGQRIKHLRTEKGITQEELGKLTNVTTQAVSRWERGGTPDAEILPLIADALGVSTDSLFGREENNKTDYLIIKELSSLAPEKAFQRAFELCWTVEMGLTGKNTLKTQFTSDMINTIEEDHEHEIFSKLLFDSGIVTARVSRDGHYFFLMPEPENGLGTFMSDIEQSAKIFRVLSDKNVLKVIAYMYSRKNTPVSVSLISAKTNIDRNEAKEIAEQLCRHQLAVKTVVETEHGEIDAYTYSRECSLLPLLIYAKEIRTKKPLDFVVMFERNKPLFE